MIEIYNDNNLNIFKNIPDNSIDLIVSDPPFNTGKVMKYKGTYYDDSMEFINYILMMTSVLKESYRVLKDDGTIYIMLDKNSVHYIKIEMDKIFGRNNFLGEIIWCYDYGGRSKAFFSNKHMTFLVYAKNKNNYKFNYNDIEREPYMAPALCGKEKAELGKLPTDVWWHSIVGTNSVERNTGLYATKKPIKLFERIIRASSNIGDIVLDMFAGSGTTGHAAEILGRDSIMIDENIQAIDAMKERFDHYELNYEIK